MQKFINQLDTIFKGKSRAKLPSHCLDNDNEELLFLEDNEKEKKTIFVKESVSEEYAEQNCFTISNRDKKDVYLWAIDGCFVGLGKPLSENYPQKCDCAFGYENNICFVEFKLHALSIAHPKTIQANREKARDQLESTICFLRDAYGQTDTLKIEGYEIEAYICTPTTYPNKNTAITNMSIEFLEKYKIGLFESNDKTI